MSEQGAVTRKHGWVRTQAVRVSSFKTRQSAIIETPVQTYHDVAAFERRSTMTRNDALIGDVDVTRIEKLRRECS